MHFISYLCKDLEVDESDFNVCYAVTLAIGVLIILHAFICIPLHIGRTKTMTPEKMS